MSPGQVIPSIIANLFAAAEACVVPQTHPIEISLTWGADKLILAAVTTSLQVLTDGQ